MEHQGALHIVNAIASDSKLIKWASRNMMHKDYRFTERYAGCGMIGRFLHFFAGHMHRALDVDVKFICLANIENHAVAKKFLEDTTPTDVILLEDAKRCTGHQYVRDYRAQEMVQVPHGDFDIAGVRCGGKSLLNNHRSANDLSVADNEGTTGSDVNVITTTCSGPLEPSLQFLENVKDFVHDLDPNTQTLMRDTRLLFSRIGSLSCTINS